MTLKCGPQLHYSSKVKEFQPLHCQGTSPVSHRAHGAIRAARLRPHVGELVLGLRDFPSCVRFWCFVTATLRWVPQYQVDVGADLVHPLFSTSR